MDRVRSGAETHTVEGRTPRESLHLCFERMLTKLQDEMYAAEQLGSQHVAAGTGLAMVPLPATTHYPAKDVVIVIVLLDEGKGTPLLEPLREMVTYAVESVHPQTVDPKEVV